MVHSAVNLNNLNRPDHDAYAASANRQSGSRLFKALPTEVRQLIYVECWRASGLRQHVFRRKRPLPPVLRDREGRLVRAEGDNPPSYLDDGEGDPYQPEEGLWTHASCTTDPCADDVRWSSFRRAAPGQSLDASMWAARLRSDWCLHWACEEEDTGHLDHYRRQNRLSRMLQQDLFRNSPAVRRHYEREIEEAPPSDPPARRWAGFLPVMLTCKQMYLESVASIYANVTFVFTDLQEAGSFLRLYGQREPERGAVRSVEVCVRIINALTELYFPPRPSRAAPGAIANNAAAAAAAAATIDDDLEYEPQVVSKYASMAVNPWARVCDLLAGMDNLHDVRIWLDTRDLRPWHKRVSEARFFARLRDVRVKSRDKRRFVLALPELPAAQAQRGLDASHWLEGDEAESVPFSIERGQRPVNWSVHMFYQTPPLPIVYHPPPPNGPP